MLKNTVFLLLFCSCYAIAKQEDSSKKLSKGNELPVVGTVSNYKATGTERNEVMPQTIFSPASIDTVGLMGTYKSTTAPQK